MKIRILLDVMIVYVPLTNGNAKRECHVKTRTKWMDGVQLETGGHALRALHVIAKEIKHLASP